jgi:hypothetical protein
MAFRLEKAHNQNECAICLGKYYLPGSDGSQISELSNTVDRIQNRTFGLALVFFSISTPIHDAAINGAIG